MPSPTQNPFEHLIQLRSGLTIYPEQDKKIDEVLNNIIENIPARFALLCDTSGQIISVCGDRMNVEPVALSALVASDLAASQEIARMLGQYQAYSMTLREGESAHTFIAEAGAHLALLVQISSEIPIGWARVLIQRGAQKLAAIVKTQPQVLSAKLNEKSEKGQEGELTELSDLFGDALEKLWTE